MAEMGKAPRDQLTPTEKGYLIQQLGIDVYRLATPCDLSQSPYTPSTYGWNNCRHLLLFKKRSDWSTLVKNYRYYSKTNPTLFPADHITFSTNSCTFIAMHWIQVTSALIFLCQSAMKFFLDTFFYQVGKKGFYIQCLLCPAWLYFQCVARHLWSPPLSLILMWSVHCLLTVAG